MSGAEVCPLESMWEPIELKGRTAHSENEATAKTKNRSAPEHVRLYLVDKVTAGGMTGRRLLGLPSDAVICDLLFWYRSRNPRALVAVELKGTDIHHAVQQLLNTILTLKSRLREARCKAMPDLYALVICSRSVPRAKTQEYEGRFRKDSGGVALRIKSQQCLVDQILDP